MSDSEEELYYAKTLLEKMLEDVSKWDSEDYPQETMHYELELILNAINETLEVVE